MRFEPGARTHWHTHPLGQTLCVVSGIGQRSNLRPGRCVKFRAGDVVWIPPTRSTGTGRRPNMLMVHIAMQEALEGKHVTWMEPVTDAQYKATVAGS